MMKLFKKPWFWAGIVVLVIFAWYLQGYFAWSGEQMGGRLENISAYTYWKFTESQQEKLEEAYKKDAHGGDTPEETLKLFVEALEAKDYDLAAKYFVVENREKFISDIEAAEKSGGMPSFINAYRTGNVVSPEGIGLSGIYEFELFEQGKTIPFGARLIKNEFTGKWKILELP